jgi:hypothetical protein
VERASSGVALSAALLKAAVNDEELFNIASSTGADGEVRGMVTDASGKPIEGITIVARDAGAVVTRAMTHSEALGLYRLRVPRGQYVVVAMNETARTYGATRPAKVAVEHAPVKRDFRLAAGGRIGGTVRGAEGAPLANVRIRVDDAKTAQPVAVLRTWDHGGYRLNLPPGSYVLRAENPTLQPYASDLDGKRVEVKSNGEDTADFVLARGAVIAGKAAPLAAVQVLEGSRRVAVLRANRAGEYRLWLKPGQYTTR